MEFFGRRILLGRKPRDIRRKVDIIQTPELNLYLREEGYFQAGRQLATK